SAPGCPRVIGVVEPECSHDWHAGFMRLPRCRVNIGQHAIAQIEILSANRLDCRIVQFLQIGRSAACNFRTQLRLADFARVPTPWITCRRGPSVSAKYRAKCSEFKPAREKLPGQLLRGKESSNVRSPER